MQIIVIAVLLIIAGLVGALLACATSLIKRVRAANTTLRRIEEALVSLNHVKAVDSVIKSAEPMKQAQPADAVSASFLTVRDLKKMSSTGRQSADNSPSTANGRKPLRTSVPTSADDRQGEIGLECTLAVPSATAAARGAVVASPKTEAIVHASQMVITTLAQKVLTANAELPIQEASDVAEEASAAIIPVYLETSLEVATANSNTLREPDEAPTADSAVGREVPEIGHGCPAASTRDVLEEGRRKKREQEVLMIITSRRRRARAGR